MVLKEKLMIFVGSAHSFEKVHREACGILLSTESEYLAC